MKQRGIILRLLVVVLLVSLLPLVILQQSLSGLFVEALQAKIFSNLDFIADHKAEEIHALVNRQVDNANMLSSLPLTRQALHDVGNAYDAGGLQSPRYQQLRRAYLHDVERAFEQQGFYDQFLITPQGEIVLTLKQEADLGTNLFTGPYRGSQLAKVTRQALMILESGVSDFEWYEPSNAHAAFIASPVMEGTRVVGVLAVQISSDVIHRVVMDDYGLGNTGETLLAQRVGEDAIIVAPLRNDPGIAFVRKFHLPTSNDLPLARALAGEHGLGEARDYRNIPVLAAWRYVPRTRWGMVVKMDLSEALAPVAHLRNIGMLLLAMTLLTAVSLAFWLGRSIVSPIQVLIDAATDIAKGRMDRRIEVLRDDEIGRLAGAFNRMTDHLASAQHELLEAQEVLELKVEQRTEALKLSEERIHSILENVLDGIISISEQGVVESFNKSAQRIFGYSAGEVIGQNVRMLMPEPYCAEHDQYLNNYATTGIRKVIGIGREVSGKRKDGSIFPMRLAVSETYQGMRRVFVGSVQDITELKEAESTLRLYASVFEHSGEAILISDCDNRILAVNPVFTQMTGYSIEEIRGMNPRILSSGQTPLQTYQYMWAALNRDGFWQGELWDRRKDGAVYPKWISISVVRDTSGTITHHFASFIDITERKAAEEHIRHLAHHDALTGLLNRLSLKQRLDQSLAIVRREQRMLAVMFLDMDRFKNINDTLGHDTGDGLLVEVARRLGEVVRESDIVARLGGDEFVVVLVEVESLASSARVAEKILASLGKPYQIGDNEVHSTPSIGLAYYPTDGDNSETLMKNADTAMYYAKSHGRNNVQFFATEMNTYAMDRMRLENDLRTGLLEEQFMLHYQPQLDSVSGRVVGVEALVRWCHPRDGLVMPANFIPIAEETSLIIPLGEWILNEACRQLSAWRVQGFANVTMAVNLSSHQLRSRSLVSFVEHTLEKHGLKGPDLELEITESAVMDNPAASIEKLKLLRNMGIRLSIDDFGTGYSSLSYLKLMPITTLKIDQTFVRDIENDANDVVICTATISLAHNLGLSVIAEGVETVAQRDFLIAHRCDVLQGFLFSEPLDAEAALEFIRAN